MRITHILVGLTGAAATALLFAVPQGWAQRDVLLLEPEEAQAELTRATRESQRAEARADRFSAEAESASDAADKTARQAAAIAAQIQAAEANIVAARARYSLLQNDREELSKRLSDRQEPLVRLTGALQTSARRPLALSALQPGSLKDLVYVRAVLDSAIPEIRKRTAALRAELDEGRRLERRAARALESLSASEEDLQTRRTALAALETQQRLASTEARSNAVRESERALALAEEARDLDGLVDTLGEAAKLRAELAALPGPIARPKDLSARVVEAGPTPATTPTSAARPPGFQLPVQGRTLAGFGELRDSGLRSKGLTLSPAPSAQVVAPSAGRVAFAGPYRGFGRIVIIEHPGGWTSLVTGLARTEVAVGDEVIGGSPLGVASGGEEPISLELRRDGEPVNPLNYLG
ncbi:peptidoglycan DD-metalloendopeptidase family protein [uncultured Erythrobacter sp.]|uniref:murein hydrolase activator EnvC family protein n=1 Tax=uncultured Erythrobacter sp. TaxID=263913 RepID=UPI002618F5C0|nr:peptidoglycan DD-metalloendopeptidase family protein [uncultured Erythrobacter sp.]